MVPKYALIEPESIPIPNELVLKLGAVPRAPVVPFTNILLALGLHHVATFAVRFALLTDARVAPS